MICFSLPTEALQARRNVYPYLSCPTDAERQEERPQDARKGGLWLLGSATLRATSYNNPGCVWEEGGGGEGRGLAKLEIFDTVIPLT